MSHVHHQQIDETFDCGVEPFECRFVSFSHNIDVEDITKRDSMITCIELRIKYEECNVIEIRGKLHVIKFLKFLA